MGEDITIHEFAHSLHLTGLNQVFPSFDKELKKLYRAAKKGNFWGADHYAMTNFHEYFGEGVQAYFDAGDLPSPPATRDQLRDKDPNLLTFIDKYLGGNNWRMPRCKN